MISSRVFLSLLGTSVQYQNLGGNIKHNLTNFLNLFIATHYASQQPSTIVSDRSQCKTNNQSVLMIITIYKIFKIYLCALSSVDQCVQLRVFKENFKYHTILKYHIFTLTFSSLLLTYQLMVPLELSKRKKVVQLPKNVNLILLENLDFLRYPTLGRQRSLRVRTK